MKDLVYFGYDFSGGEESRNNRARQEEYNLRIKTLFPEAVLEDAYDQIKGFRTAVELPEDKKDEYFIFMIGEGWFGNSLNLLVMKGTTEGIKYLTGILPEVKKRYPRPGDKNEEVQP